MADFLNGGGTGFFGCGSDLVDAAEGVADGVDGDLGDDEVAVEEVLVAGDVGDSVQGDHVVSVGEGELPEAGAVFGVGVGGAVVGLPPGG